MSLLHRAAALAAILLAACASTPQTRFYTLMPPVAAAPAAAASARYAIEVLPVSVPDQVDVPQLVVRLGGGELALVESRQWAAPLGRELRAAVSDRLSRALGARDVYRLAVVPGTPVWRIKVDVTRFESELGRAALIEAGWSIAGEGRGAALTCASAVREAVGEGYEALVAGHQKALDALAARIAQALRALDGHQPACPG